VELRKGRLVAVGGLLCFPTPGRLVYGWWLPPRAPEQGEMWEGGSATSRRSLLPLSPWIKTSVVLTDQCHNFIPLA
jgi:hypothetical protein